jgi:hypothetical protein
MITTVAATGGGRVSRNMRARSEGSLELAIRQTVVCRLH